MGKAEDDEHGTNDADRAAILKRRARLVVGTLGGLLLPVATTSCDPTPCLSIAVVPTATAQSSSVETTPTSAPSLTPSTAAPSARAPLPPGWFEISAADAEKQGLPAVGFRAAMTRGGWSVHEQRKDIYVSASGPPGGPLSVRVSAYRDAAASLEALFKQAVSDSSGLDPIVVGAAETVTLGGRQLAAQSFLTGRSLATTNWCLIKAPAADGKSGALFLFGTSGRSMDKPTCAPTLAHEPIAEIVKSLAFDP